MEEDNGAACDWKELWWGCVVLISSLSHKIWKAFRVCAPYWFDLCELGCAKLRFQNLRSVGVLRLGDLAEGSPWGVVSGLNLIVILSDT